MADLENLEENEQTSKVPGEPLRINVFGGQTIDDTVENPPVENTGEGEVTEPAPTPEVTSPETEDFQGELLERRKGMAEDAEFQDALKYLGLSENREPGATKPEEPKEKPPPKTKLAGAVMDVTKGVIDAPRQIVGGARDAVQATLEGINDMAAWVADSFDPNEAEGIAALGKEGYEEFKKKQPKDKAPIQLPEVGKSDTVTGGVIRGMSQFITGFAGAGAAMKGVSAAGKVAQGAKAMAQGGLADFAVFEPHEKRLANVLKEDLGLKNAFIDWLSADEKDRGTLEGRFKNVVEGMVVGPIAEGFMRGVKALAKGSGNFLERMMQHFEGKPAAKELVETPPDLSILGKVDGELLEKVGPMQASISETERGLVGATEGTDIPKVGPKAVRSSPKGKDQFYINFARIDTEEQVENVLQNMATKGEVGIEQHARGKRTHAETVAAAERENAWKLLQERKVGDTLNAEQTKAIRDLWTASGEKLAEVAELAAKSPTEENLFAFMKMKQVHAWVQNRVLGVRREQARALNQWAIPSQGGRKQMLDDMAFAINNSGGIEVAREMAMRIAMLAKGGNLAAFEKAVERSWKVKTMDAIADWWYFSLLSGPKSHARNIISNTAFAFAQLYERGFAEMLSKQWNTEGGVVAGEAAAMFYGMRTALMESFSAMLASVKTSAKEGTLLKDTKKFLLEGPEATKFSTESVGPGISSEGFNIASNTTWGRFLDTTHAALKSPSRLLGKADDLFRGVAKRMELHAQALRVATHELKGAKPDPEAFAKRIAELVEAPTKEMEEIIEAQARYQTFSNRPEGALADFANQLQRIPILGRLVMPFKNVAVNITNVAVEHTPLAFGMKKFRAEVAAGGARRDIALSRMATGSMMLAIAMDLALNKQIKAGFPAHPGEKENWKASGKMSNSIQVGDTQVQFSGVDPMGFIMSIGAHLANAVLTADEDVSQKDFEEIFAVTSFAVSEAAQDKTVLSGFAEFMDAVNNPQMKAYNYTKRQIGSALSPGILASLAQAMDPNRREVETWADAFMARFPWWRERLALHRDMWGRPIKDGTSSVTMNLINPIQVRTEKMEPINQELERLNYYPGRPSDILTIDGARIRMNAHQKSRYMELAGNLIEHPAYEGKTCLSFLNDVVTGDSAYSGMYDEMKRRDAIWGTTEAPDFIKSVINDYRQMARDQLMSEDGALQMEYELKTERRPWAQPAESRFRPTLR